jgi:hypothetical protein
MEVTGILVKKTCEREGVSSRNGMPWKIAEYLIEIPGQYPRHINFRVSDGQVGRLARFDSLVGKTVTVSFDIDAHEYEGRWFNELNAWGVIEYVDSTTRQANITAAQAAQQPAAESSGTETKIPAPQAEGNGDDLPF